MVLPLLPQAFYTPKPNFCIGKEIYSKISGSISLSADSAPLHDDAVLKLGSATKLITSIALLQCVERGLIKSLDEPLTSILPELDGMKILKNVTESSEFIYEPTKTPITARHLLSHTSGMGYRFTHPLLGKRAEYLDNLRGGRTFEVTERYNLPLIYEPGQGWWYGCSLDWAGVAVSRLNGGVSLEEYFVRNIWTPLGLQAPFPRFNISRYPEYEARILHGAKRVVDADGAETLEECDTWAFDNPEDQDGGSGLSSTTADFVAVLADLVSSSPVLLKEETLKEMFTPQMPDNGPGVEMLLKLRVAWDAVAGPISPEYVNHGLGGLLCTGPVPDIKQAGNTLAWGGATNVIWWANRDLAVAGFFATQQAPFGNETVNGLVNAWKRDFWTRFEAVQ
jgi:CubicO group peptidase (beta-lactamase class C family)